MVSQSETQERDMKNTRRGGDAPQQVVSLALLYEDLLTAIVRVQSRRQHIPDCEAFRRRTKVKLQEIEQVALTAGYDGRDVQETHFAVAAFLDSVVLHSDESVRAEWERKTLQEEMFGQRDAGVVFFEKLEDFRSRRDSEQLADILEVYLLCLLLGFEGRYSGGLRSELESITERVRKRIEDIRALRRQISPSGDLPTETAAAPPPRIQRINHFRWYMLAAAGFTLLCFLVSKLILYFTGSDVLKALG